MLILYKKKTPVRYRNVTIRMAEMEKTDQALLRVVSNWNPQHRWREHKMVQPLWKMVVWFVPQ